MRWPELMKILTYPDLPLRANQKLVALVILQYVDIETLKCYPSIDEISRRAGVSRNTACKAIGRLVELQLLDVD